MLQILADNMYIESSAEVGTSYTEPIEMKGNDSVILEAWVISASGLSTGGVQVFPQGSNDLENWKDFDSGYGLYIYSPASWNSAPGYSSTLGSIDFDYVRLKILLNDVPARAVVRAGVKLVRLP